MNLLLVDPGVGVVAKREINQTPMCMGRKARCNLRPLGDTLLAEPEVNFLLGVLDAKEKIWVI